MKKRILVTVALMLVVAMSLSSCGLIDWVKNIFAQTFGEVVELTDAPLNAEKLIDFADGANPDVLFESDGWSNGDVFNVVWKQHNVHYENGIMRLGITQEKATAWLNDVEVEFDYTAGEARTQNYYHYGDYEVSMKPSANGGTASTFFTCTGPYDVKDGTPNPHDEIDIEFLGKDTTHVQFNFFVDGKGGNEYMHELGFDASEGFHTYGYRWEENAITWFVDGVPVYKVTTDTSVDPAKNVRIVEKIPSTPGRILTNYWCGNAGAVGWMGLYTGANKDNGTEYQWIATSAEGAPLNPPVEPPVDGGDDPVDPSEPTRLDVEFKTDHGDLYTIEAPEQFCDSARITYAGVIGGTWSNVNTWLDGKIGGYDTLSFKIRNDGEAEVKIWLQLQNAGANIAEQQLSIPAGEEKAFEVSYSGNVQIALFFIDSSHVVTEGAEHSGDITISEIKVQKKGADEPVDPQPPVDLPDGEYLEFKADPVYTLHNEEQYVNSIRVTYDNVSTLTYQNVNAWIKDKAEGKSEWTATIRNDGAAEVYVTLKLETEDKVGLKEEKLYVAPGETKTLASTFEGEAAMIYFFIDSGWVEGEATTHAGDVTISNIAFSGEATPDVGGDDPVDPPAEEELKLDWWTSSSDYTVSGNNIKYNGAGNSYSCAGAPITAFASGKTTFTVTITNNGEAASRVRVDIQGENKIGNHTVINTGATGGDVWTDADWGGSTVTVPAGESVTLVITYDENTDRGAVTNLVVMVDSGRGDGETYNSDVTLSGMAFSGEASAPVEPQPEEPVEGEYLSFTANECYTLSATADQYVNSVQITYTEVSDNTYQNVNTWIQDKAAGKTAVGVTIKNNGSEAVTITVKLENGAGEAAETKVVLAAGATQTVELAYDFAPDLLYFFIDSGWAEATATHAGDVTISGINFK